MSSPPNTSTSEPAEPLRTPHSSHTPQHPAGVLGAKEAKKRLQSFTIQKKQSGISSVSGVSGSPKKIAANLSRSDPPEELDKSKGTIKKGTKKEMNGYERSRASFINMMKMKEEEDKKLALVRLGIPLGLLPAGNVVKGLTPKPMPTKAMPPLKNSLNAEQLEKLLKNATTSGELDLDIIKLPKDDRSKHDRKPSKSKDRHNSRERRNRNSKGIHSDESRRRDHRNRNNWHHDRNRRDSYSRSKTRENERKYSSRTRENDSKYRSKKGESSSSSHSRSKTTDPICNSKNSSREKVSSNSNKNSKVSDYVIASLYGSDALKNIDADKNEKITSKKITHPPSNNVLISPAVLKDKGIVDMFSYDDQSLTPKIEDEKSAEMNKYNKFLEEKFVPILSVDHTQKTWDLSPINRNSSPPAELLVNFQKVNDEKAANTIEFYSPGILSSNGETSLVIKSPARIEENNFCDYIFGGEELSKFSLEPEVANSETETPEAISKIITNNVNLQDESNTPWNDVTKSCHLITHISSECFRTTLSTPHLSFYENPKYCKCTQDSKQPLLNNSQIDEAFSYSPIKKNHSRPLSCESSEKENPSMNFYSNWEIDDSPLQLLRYNNERDFNSRTCDSDSFSKSSNSELKYASSVISNEIQLHTDKSDFDNVEKNMTGSSENICDVKSLNSEYEKFMEAVGSEICDSSSSQYDSSSIKNNSISKESHISQDIKDSAVNINLSKTFHSNNIDNHQQNVKNTHLESSNMQSDDNTELSSINMLSDSKTKSNTPNKNEKDWGSGSDCEETKNDESRSPKLRKQRKGHAKVSSRRLKRKQKSQKKKSSRSLSDNSSSSETSSSTSNDMSSESDSSSSINSEDSLLTSSDISSSTNSSPSSSNSSTNKKKKKYKKKKTRKMSKSKREKLKIFLKAKKIAKKMRLEKKMRKRREKLALKSNRGTCNENENTQEDLHSKDSLPVISQESDMKKRKRKALDHKTNCKKYRSDNVSTDILSSPKVKIHGNKRNFNQNESFSDSEDSIAKKRCKIKQHDQMQVSYNENTVMNIKKEKTSDDEGSLKNKNIVEVKRTSSSIYRQDIVCASELQNHFLHGTNDADAANIKIETEVVSSRDNLLKHNIADTKLYKLSEPLSKPDFTVKCDENNENISSIKCNLNVEFDDSCENEQALYSHKNYIKNVSTSSKNQMAWKLEKEKPDFCDSPRSRSISKVGNSSLIEIPIKSNNEPRDNGLINIKPETSIENNDLKRKSFPSEHDSRMESGSLPSESSGIYKIPTIDSRSSSNLQQIYTHDIENYDLEYDIYDKHQVESEPIRVTNLSSRKISLDDRINWVLQYPGQNIPNICENASPEDTSIQNVQFEIYPDKGILISGNSKTIRADPRLNRAKRVSFADGLVPGQDSDCESGINIKDFKETKVVHDKKFTKKKRSSCGGHPYPCPESWPDYHPQWDKLPPPPPPPGSPPPDLCESINNSQKIQISPLIDCIPSALPNIDNLILS